MWIPKFTLFRWTLIVGVILCCVLYSMTGFDKKFSFPLQNAFFNHPSHTPKDGILDDFLNATVKPDGGRSIFFFVTNNFENGEISLLPR